LGEFAQNLHADRVQVEETDRQRRQDHRDEDAGQAFERLEQQDQRQAATADRKAVPVGLAGEDRLPELQDILQWSATVDADAEQLWQLADEHGQGETGGLKARSTRQLP